jgi:flagellar protein FliO/FliZ
MKWLCLALFSIASNRLFAAEPDSSAGEIAIKTPPRQVEVLGYGELTEVVVGLLLVVCFILLAAWVVRKFNKGMIGSGRHIRVLSHLSLGIKEKVVLVQVGGQQILLGVTPSSVNKLHVFDEPVIDPGADAPADDFAGRLRDILVQGKRQ